MALPERTHAGGGRAARISEDLDNQQEGYSATLSLPPVCLFFPFYFNYLMSADSSKHV